MFKRLLPVLLALCVPLLLASPAMAAFGLAKVEMSARNQNGTPAVQAGAHPYGLTTTFELNEPQRNEQGLLVPQGDLKDAELEIPPGFVGNPDATPRCAYQTFITKSFAGSLCPNETAVGVATTYFTFVASAKEQLQVSELASPVYSLVPPAGVAAEFGFKVANEVPAFLDVSVRSGGDYGLTVRSSDISQAALVYASKVTIWGVPAAASHNPYRGRCLREVSEGYNGGLGEGEDELEGPVGPFESGHPIESRDDECPVDSPEVPLLTNPTSCGAPRVARLSVDDWEEPGVFDSESTSLPELVGCEGLDFSPTIGVTPDGSQGSTPTGLNVDVHMPQESTTNPLGSAEADVKDTTVGLPAGVQLSPSAADGLQACSTSEIGFEGFKELDPTVEPGVQTAQFSSGAPSCPDASKVANVRIKTPLLEGELEGSVYLASPQNFVGVPENPFSSLLALYLVAKEPKAGVLIKLSGKVAPDPVTGQLTTTFENTPQLPFSELHLEFYGTDRAPLATPALCGTYKTEASLVPWSGTPAVSPSSSFQITSGPNGSACSDPLPFSPSLESGTTNINAGGFSPLVTTISREDGQQSIHAVTLHYPPGVSGEISGVPLCGEAQANAGTCGPESLIGETIVSVGLGNDPFSVTGGKVYLTGPYAGAPFGLSIVNPAQAGPFDLQEGRPVVVRAKIEINQATASLTVTTDASGEHAIPSIIDGIPLQIKHVYVNINRPGFTFNPTKCNPTKVTGVINSAEGASSPVEVPFQVTNCAALKFAPHIAFSTNGKTSKQNGADLITKLTYPSASQGTYANIGYVKVELPKALPSRLTTLQKACTAAQFEANPAGCPPESKVGYATVHTPLLPVPLTGPAIFVSHGGEAFPSLTMVLQGYGVTIDLVGTTFISKAGVTSTTFKAVPDVPFSTFELVLPQGPFSALTANRDLCTEPLVIPNEFVSQAGGAPIKQDSTISVTGCPAAIAVVSHKVKGKTATITVSVPAAGKLVATAEGLSKASKTAKGAATLTLKLTLTNGEGAALSKHKGRKLKAKVNLSFTPKKGGKLKTATTVLID